ncbi:hydroxyethylthiazole kinase [Luteimonas yindakuii]|uniref:hydroxyethylthiazole kinase n=1 Tax=Luteimonas yindakuii TaxID=2565782 RepID=UPI0011076595|nr:hydroxyethylthiazole kinase [Luteimonas yindakuii]QCO67887.2 hydroxyethylthiazole kinase [Luteimonas yindakuii]
MVIRHDTTIGSNGDAETEVRFYSIYMHLNDIRSANVVEGQLIHRKTELGTAGMFEGSANLIHFEIVCDDANLQRLIGRNVGVLDLNADGRTDAVFGEMYFRLPAGAFIYSDRPALNQPTGTGGEALGDALLVGIRYERGNAQVTTYRADGAPLGASLTEDNAEYDLYRNSGRIVEAYRAARAPQVPAHSATYELLRFGRILGPDALTPTNTPHWRQIRTRTGQGWTNLNATGVTKYSDADAPHWVGWHLLQDYDDHDSRCDVAPVRRVLDEDADGINTRSEADRRLMNAAIQPLLRGLVCKFPTEWQRTGLAARWNWLTTEGPNETGGGRPTLGGNTHLSQADFSEFQRHAEALAFWEDAKLEGIGPTHWHFHPMKFIEHFRKCGWLSRSDLARIYTSTSERIRETYRVSLNRVARKYFYSSNLVRLSHFIGQGAIESTSLRSMQEASMTGRIDGENFYGQAINQDSRTSENQAGHWYGAIPPEDDAWFRSTKYNSRGQRIASSYNWRNGNLGDPHAQQYRGRGFKQLTGLINYSRYWMYRGWLDPESFDNRWWEDPQYRARDAARMALRPPRIDDPQRATETAYNCIDTGGWYLGAERPDTLREVDLDSNDVASTPAERATERNISYAVTRAINGGGIQRDDRLRETRSAKEILL